MSFPLLSSLLVRDAVSSCSTIPAGLPITEAIPILDRDPDSGAVLLDHKREFGGVVTARQLEKLPPEEMASGTVDKLAIKEPVLLKPEDRMDVALEQLTARGLSWAPVVESGNVFGKLTVKDAIATYRNTLERSIRRTNSLPGDATLFEAQLKSSSPLAGKSLQSAGLPPGTLVVSIMRQTEAVFPHGDTRLEPGDTVVIMAAPSSERALREFLGDIKKSGTDAPSHIKM